ncbi:nuclear protein UL24 [Testudinid alphaherpesvirus 3]|uniref:Nuclear protein UL24 n=1 Tax=Testudinid alphaherpesvirus 3 TaxID=2560801 RepID=A0A0M3MXH0_9ALPH|nr:nuclear protein UL24 [Testudinid alphaherpesvirus 3]AKI81657.1 nuclear protein UL24 [Testudinid alphaherpesvirus 3]AKI81760.1 nuclear protein UL24 [Testudinid alphaherpesvirus 3]
MVSEKTSGRSLRSRFNAGIRCHNRFFQVLANAVYGLRNGFRGNGCKQLNQLLSGLIETHHPTRDIYGTLPLFEVTLGGRRADFILLTESREEKKICILGELKTCKHVGNMTTPSKANQRLEGLAQLRDGTRYIRSIITHGTDRIVLCPTLLFAAQKDLRIVSVCRIGTTELVGSFRNLRQLLSTWATLSIPPRIINHVCPGTSGLMASQRIRTGNGHGGSVPGTSQEPTSTDRLSYVSWNAQPHRPPWEDAVGARTRSIEDQTNGRSGRTRSASGRRAGNTRRGRTYTRGTGTRRGGGHRYSGQNRVRSIQDGRPSRKSRRAPT